MKESANEDNAGESCDQSIDDNYELELFNMVEVQLADAQQRRLILPSNSDDVSDRERLHSLQNTAAEDGRANISEDSCCSKSFAVTATTVTSSTPPSLPSDDDVNFF